METRIEFDDSYAMLTAALNPGEQIKAEPGAMVAQAGVEMTTGLGGNGVFGGIRRMMGGESFFVNTFAATHQRGWVSLAPPAPGDIEEMRLNAGEAIYIQGSSFLAAEGEVEIDSQFQGLRGMFSGEGMFFLRAAAGPTPGRVWVNAYGAIKRLEIRHGEEVIVDTGHLVAFTPGVDYSISRVGGIRSLIGGGEGLVTRCQGNGQIWIQSRNLSGLADKIAPFLPSR